MKHQKELNQFIQDVEADHKTLGIEPDVEAVMEAVADEQAKHREEVVPEEYEACDHCNEATEQLGEDGISVCENCGIVEGSTHMAVDNE